ncbi:Ulp1-like peptidase [Cucumis melo var. makuwa]|uniref:Ulp1-like peptidase n=1 Tax=Cucumis melo var. makuwa TaxID=1194695 RepID=A0A5D3BTD5_CUCMM|nr:Ulp1-like peptidase [Cucumis melo var. makuwa]
MHFVASPFRTIQSTLSVFSYCSEASIMTSTSTDGPLYKINPSHHFYALVEDEGKDYISFLLGGVVCTFGRREFNIITGLWGPKEESIQLVGNSSLLEKFFKENECIYGSDLEDIFLEYEGDDDDIVKLTLVYFIELSLLGKDRQTKVDIDKVNDDVIPRMLRWVCQQSPKSQTINQVFDSPMLIIKAVIEMTPQEEQLKIASSELFENLCPSTIVQSKNDGSKRGREVVNDEGDFKKSKKQKLKSKMKKAIWNLQDRVAVVEWQLTSDEGDHKGFEGLESEEVDNAKTEDVDTGGTSNWLRMPKDDDTRRRRCSHVGTPPWLRFNIELEKSINVLEKKVEIGLKEPIDVVDDEVEIEDSGKELRTHFDSDVTEI